MNGNVEKSHQRRSRNFVVLTYWKYAPRVKIAAALLDDFFDHSRRLLVLKSSRVYTGFLRETFNRPMNNDPFLLTPISKLSDVTT
jgi:hypothetical protein